MLGPFNKPGVGKNYRSGAYSRDETAPLTLPDKPLEEFLRAAESFGAGTSARQHDRFILVFGNVGKLTVGANGDPVGAYNVEFVRHRGGDYLDTAPPEALYPAERILK